MLKKYDGVWNEVKNCIRRYGGEVSNYNKDYTMIRFESDDNLQFNISLKIHALTIIIRSVLDKKMVVIIHTFF